MIHLPFRVSAGLIVLLVALLTSTSSTARNPPDSAFAPKNGERIVFLGNSIFENDLQYNYLELALTTRWPDRNITFRNLGWTGDMVRGDARGDFTNPPTANEIFLSQLTHTKPTLVFIAYGNVEALEGEKALPRFLQGLDLLLDTIDKLGAASILLSPIPVFTDSAAKQNAILQLYTDAIAKKAAARGKRFIDIFSPLSQSSNKAGFTDHGIHLNENGYYSLTSAIEKSLGLSVENAPVTIQVSKQQTTASLPGKIIDSSDHSGDFTFSIKESWLPLPLPEKGAADNIRILKITGLKKGFYTLTNDELELTTASAEKWKEGVELRQGASFNRSAQLRNLILKKNELYFNKYRPLNRTYILGFRAYEQGKHVKGLEDMELIITYLERQIALNRTTKPNIYKLAKLK